MLGREGREFIDVTEARVEDCGALGGDDLVECIEDRVSPLLEEHAVSVLHRPCEAECAIEIRRSRVEDGTIEEPPACFRRALGEAEIVGREGHGHGCPEEGPGRAAFAVFSKLSAPGLEGDREAVREA